MLIQIPHFSGWINTSLITDIEVVGENIEEDGCDSGLIWIHFAGTRSIRASFDTESQAIDAAKAIAERINFRHNNPYDVYVRQSPKENPDTTVEES